MNVMAYKTSLLKPGDDLGQLLIDALPDLTERTVLVIASKAFATCENRFVPKVSGTREEKYDLVRQEAELYTDPHSSQYDLMLTVKRNCLFVNAGLDESNANNQYLLWPADPQQSLNDLWQFLRSHYGLKEFGLIMSDSTSFPLNWGVVGRGIAHCGFNPLKSYVGKPDLFGRLLKMEKVNVAQSLVAAGVWEMGEGDEQTPVAVIGDLPSVEFLDHAPTDAELGELKINIEDDAYAPILLKAEWKKGGGKS